MMTNQDNVLNLTKFYFLSMLQSRFIGEVMKTKLLLVLSILLINHLSFADKNSAKYVKTVINKINNGDKDILKEISYEDLNYVIDYSYHNLGHFPLVVRAKVVNSALNGLFNKDPRVRLISIDILRRFTPDRLMAPEIELSYKAIKNSSLNLNTKQRKYSDYYEYRNIYGKNVKKSLAEETTKLYKFMRRDQLIYHIKNKDGYYLKQISKEDFLILVKPIDKEPISSIPLLSTKKVLYFKATQLKMVLAGMENSNLTVKRGTALYLIEYYNNNAKRLDPYYRNQIISALKKAYKNNLISKPRLIKVYSQ